MKNWINRFAMLAVLSSLVGSMVVAGCGGGDTSETTTTDANGATTKTKTETDE